MEAAKKPVPPTEPPTENHGHRWRRRRGGEASPTAADTSSDDDAPNDVAVTTETLAALADRLRYFKSLSANPDMVESNIQAVEERLRLRQASGGGGMQDVVQRTMITPRKGSRRRMAVKGYDLGAFRDGMHNAREAVLQGLEVPKNEAESAAAAAAAARKHLREGLSFQQLADEAVKVDQKLMEELELSKTGAGASSASGDGGTTAGS